MSIPMHRDPLRPAVRPVARTVLPTDEGVFAVHAYTDDATGTDHVALVLGDVAATAPTATAPTATAPTETAPTETAPTAPLVRIHSECLTGDALGSHRCDCGDQLRAARRAIAAEGRGVIVYLRGHEGRGIGLVPKLQAYALQDDGLDTVDANLALGLAVDRRDYAAAGAVLAHLGVDAVRLLSGNPVKARALRRHGVEVLQCLPLPVPDRPENVSYLHTKRVRMGHLPAPPAVTAAQAWSELVAGRVPADPRPGRDAELVDRYAPLVGAGPDLVVAQLGQSLDGFIAARTGDAVFVTGEADREHLHRLRALVDAVVVGVCTVVADDPRLTVRAVPGPNPVRVLLDPSARAPRDAALLTDGAAPTLWVVAAADPGDRSAPGTTLGPPTAPAAHVAVLPLPAPGGRIAPHRLLAALADRGLGRVLVEGGGRTVSAFLAAGALDRLFVTTAPLLIGDGVPGLRFDGTDRLRDALRAPVRRFALGDDVCMELDLSRRD